MERRAGFTLVELAIAIGVISILISGILIFGGGYRQEAVVEATASYVLSWKKALGRYYGIYGNFPSSLTENSFNSRFLNTNPPDGIRLTGYSRTGCSGQPAIVLDAGDSATLNRLNSLLSSRGEVICGVSGTSILVRVLP